MWHCIYLEDDSIKIFWQFFSVVATITTSGSGIHFLNNHALFCCRSVCQGGASLRLWCYPHFTHISTGCDVAAFTLAYTHTDMFRTKVRIHTCKVIVLTSLVWLLVDVVVLMFYSDCTTRGGWGCGGGEAPGPTPQALVASSGETATSSKGRGNLHELMRDRGKKTYSPWELVKWKPAPHVLEQVSFE